MRKDIIEINAFPNRPHGDYIVSVAIQSSPGRWQAFYKQVDSLSDQDINLVVTNGEKLTEHRAKDLFDQYISKNLKYS